MSVTLDYLEAMNTGLIAIRGTGRSGKTATAHWLLQEHLNDRPVVTLSPNPISDVTVKDFTDVPNDSTLFLDDTALYLHARKFGSKTNIQFSQVLTVYSHKDIRVLCTVQNLSLLDISAFMSQDVVLLFKHSSWHNIDQERPEFRTKVAIANLLLEDCPFPRQRYTYSSLGEIIENPLPSGWCEKSSKPYRDISLKEVIT